MVGRTHLTIVQTYWICKNKYLTYDFGNNLVVTVASVWYFYSAFYVFSRGFSVEVIIYGVFPLVFTIVAIVIAFRSGFFLKMKRLNEHHVSVPSKAVDSTLLLYIVYLLWGIKLVFSL